MNTGDVQAAFRDDIGILLIRVTELFAFDGFAAGKGDFAAFGKLRIFNGDTFLTGKACGKSTGICVPGKITLVSEQKILITIA